MRTIDKKTVRHVATLSRLSLSKDEEELFSGQLSLILDYIDQLKKVDTKNVTATSHVLSSVKNVFRKDAVKKSLSAQDALSNAPNKSDNMFVVPKVIDQ